MPDTPAAGPELLHRIESRWGALQALLAALTPSQLRAPLGDGWSAVVHAGHVAAWEASLAALLGKQDRAAAMGLPPAVWAVHDTDAINLFVAERTAALPVQDVLSSAVATHAGLIRLLESMSRDDLAGPYSEYQPDDLPYNPSPVVGWVHGNTWEHYDEHIGWLEAGLRD